jgi:hypothetical protein
VRSSGWRRVISAFMPRMAATYAANRQGGRAKSPMAPQGLEIVLRAARLEPARWREHRSHHPLIEPHETAQSPPREAHSLSIPPVIACRACFIDRSAWRISASSAGNGRVATAERATKIASTPDPSARCSRRYASRSRRRARFRLTAPPNRRLVANATRRPAAPARHSARKLALSSRLPCWKSVWNSAARRIPSRRGRDSSPGGVRPTPN